MREYLFFMEPCGDQVLSWLDSVTNGALKQVAAYFPDGKKVYAVGGAVRDYFLKRTPTDLDITVAGATDDELDRIPRVSKTYFGSPILNINGVSIDLWRLETSPVLLRAGLPPTIEGMLRIFDFNLERIAVECHSKELVDLGCCDGVEKRVIEYDPFMKEDSVVQAFRAIILKRKTGFEYSSRKLELLATAREKLEDPKECDQVENYFASGNKYVNELPSLKKELLNGFRVKRIQKM